MLFSVICGRSNVKPCLSVGKNQDVGELRTGLSYRRWNYQTMYLVCSIWKSPLPIHSVRGIKQISIIPWRFRRIIYVQRRNIKEVFKNWSWVVFHLKNKIWQEVCYVATRGTWSSISPSIWCKSCTETFKNHDNPMGWSLVSHNLWMTGWTTVCICSAFLWETYGLGRFNTNLC